MTRADKAEKIALIKRDKLWCQAIVATQKVVGKPGRLVCDVQELLHYFNSHRRKNK